MESDNVQEEKIILKFSDLDNYDIPDIIKSEMYKWPVICKSPYSDSFYSSTDVDWDYKPDQSFRVSDHWNFKSYDKIHCKTDKRVTNRATITLGIYNDKEGRYKVLLNTPTKAWREKEKIKKEKSIWLKNEFLIQEKREFKNRILSGEIFAKVITKNSEIEGKVFKYTGHEIKVGEPGRFIYNNNYLTTSDVKIQLMDISGNVINDIFKIEGYDTPQ
jgi:hypothetical protein